jgi:hypothetical protein
LDSVRSIKGKWSDLRCFAKQGHGEGWIGIRSIVSGARLKKIESKWIDRTLHEDANILKVVRTYFVSRHIVYEV